MRELIGSILLIVGFMGVGSFALKEFDYMVHKAVLKHVGRGLPSLTRLTAVLRHKKHNQ